MVVIIMLLFMLHILKNKKMNIAILTSERANISDPRVRELSDGIIEVQVKEIAEIKRLIEDLKNEE